MKLQVKVLLLVTVILLIICTISGGTIIYFQRRASIDQFEQMAIALAVAVQSSLEQGMLTGERSPTQEAIVRITEKEVVNEGNEHMIDDEIKTKAKLLESDRYFPNLEHGMQPMATFDGLRRFMTVLHEVTGNPEGEFPRL